jgi:DHA2 family multidrug resistance protein
MNQPAHLKPWLSSWSWGTRIALFTVLLSGIIQFVTFALSQNYVISYLGAQPEDITFSIQICYAGIISALPILSRFLRWFKMKYYLLVMMMLGVLLSIASMYTTDIYLFFTIRFFQGAVVCSISISVLTLIPGFLKPERRQVVGSSIFYGTLLSSGILFGVVASQVSLNGDFTGVYNYLILVQIIAMIIVLLGYNGRSNMRRYPLYQIDWIAAVLFVAAAIALAYVLVYGSKYYWFSDNRIVTGSLICLAAGILYIYRNLTVKRPLLDLSVFTYPKFWLGLILLALYYGMKETINIIFGYTASVLQWSAPQVIELGLCNVAGIIIFVIISAAILIRKKDAILGFLITGFSMSLLYHLWMYFIFTPDLAFGDLVVPMFFQGAASGVLFVPIMIFTLNAVPPSTGITGLAIAAFTRFATLLNSGAGFYNLQLYYGQLYREHFLYHLTDVDQNALERLNSFRQLFMSKGYTSGQAEALANVSLNRALGVQVQLLTSRATFLFITVITAIVLLFIIVVFLYKYFKSRQSIQIT